MMLMSPRSTLKNCGNSSRLCLRRKRPTQVDLNISAGERVALDAVDPARRAAARLVFTAHSVPVSMAADAANVTEGYEVYDVAADVWKGPAAGETPKRDGRDGRGDRLVGELWRSRVDVSRVAETERSEAQRALLDAFAVKSASISLRSCRWQRRSA